MPYLNGQRLAISEGVYSHAGLWLEKQLSLTEHRNEQAQVARFLIGHTPGRDEAKPKAKLIEAVPAIAARGADLYTGFYDRWCEQLAKFPGTELRQGTALGRVLVGTGGANVLETNLTLHRTYGVPVLPGSALKGLCSSYAHKALGEGWQRPATLGGEAGEHQRLLFGDTTFAGLVTFHDAMPIPKTWQLEPDIITVHHQDYYNTNTDITQPPADWDSPIPIPMVSASGQWQFALTGAPQWLGLAFGILRHALLELGIGAKTSSGYGRIKLEQSQTELLAAAVQAEQHNQKQALTEALNTFQNRVSERFMSFREIPQKIPKLAEELLAHPAEAAAKRSAAQALLERLRRHPDSGHILGGATWSEELRRLAGEPV